MTLTVSLYIANVVLHANSPDKTNTFIQAGSITQLRRNTVRPSDNEVTATKSTDYSKQNNPS